MLNDIDYLEIDEILHYLPTDKQVAAKKRFNFLYAENAENAWESLVDYIVKTQEKYGEWSD